MAAERPLSLNPLVDARDPTVRDVGELLYRRLLRLDASAEPVPDLAAAMSVSSDGLTYTLTLARGQEWSDGHPITVADVAATLAWVQSPSFGDAPTAAPWQQVHVRTGGDSVTFDLAAPQASFPAQLTQLPILPLGALTPAQIGALRSTAARPLPTSGPFWVAAATATTLDLFPNTHSRTPPQLHHVELDLVPGFAEALAAFRAGSDDGVLAADPRERAELVSAGGMAHPLTTFRFVDLLFNERVPLLADPAVRALIAASVDRRGLVDGPLQGMAQAQPGPIPRGITWAQPSAAVTPAAGPVVDPGAALAAEGWSRGPDGVLARDGTRLALSLDVADAAPLPALARALAQQVSGAGAKVSVTTVPIAQMRAALTSSPPAFDMALADWDNGPDPDVSLFWRSTATPPAGFYVSGGEADPFLDQALDRLATLGDAAARRAALATVSLQLSQDLPAVFIETPEEALVTRGGIRVQLPQSGNSGARWADIATWRH
ncbi:MAG: ABC transporter substrate-binding protein [Candidatus Dormibacteria bacterium]